MVAPAAKPDYGPGFSATALEIADACPGASLGRRLARPRCRCSGRAKGIPAKVTRFQEEKFLIKVAV